MKENTLYKTSEFVSFIEDMDINAEVDKNPSQEKISKIKKLIAKKNALFNINNIRNMENGIEKSEIVKVDQDMKEALRILKEHQDWRQGESEKATVPAELTKSIDTILNFFK